MPATSEKERKFMGADLARKRAGKKTRTGMSESDLEDFARKPKMKARHGAAALARRSGGCCPQKR